MTRAIIILAVLAAAAWAAPALALSPYQPPGPHGRLLAEAQRVCRVVRAHGQPCQVRDLLDASPNYYNLAVAQAMELLQRFALQEAERPRPNGPLAVRPSAPGAAARLAAFLADRKDQPGSVLLQRLLPAAQSLLPGQSPDRLARAMSQAALGDAPTRPGRLFPLARALAGAYLARLFPATAEQGGGMLALPANDPAAAWEALFLALENSRVLTHRDWIAVLNPLAPGPLSPPSLKRFRHINLYLKRHPKRGWELPLEEVAKLNDSKVKALFLANPPAVGAPALSPAILAQIAKVVRYQNPRLLLLTASSLAGAGGSFRPLARLLPGNLITVYSFAPRYGLAGWRAGLLALPRQNLPDILISRLSEEERWEIVKRYAPKGVPSKQVPFARRLRLEAQWRGGFTLSAPQQVMVALYSLFGLGKSDLGYAAQVEALLRSREKALLQGLSWRGPSLLEREGPFARLDLGLLAEKRYGKEFARDFRAQPAEELLLRMARRYRAVAAPPGGRGASGGMLLLSLAGMDRRDCRQVGVWLGREMEYYHAHWRARAWGRLLGPLVKLDHALFRLINGSWTNPLLDLVMPPISSLVPLVPLLLAGLWLVLRGGVPGRYILGGCLLLFLFTDFCLSQFLRPGLGRIAPFADLVGVRRLLDEGWRLTSEFQIATANLAYSLPSAHAANSMGPAVFLGCFFPAWRRVLIPLALLVGWSRIYLGVHFPGDVALGFLWGGMWGWALAWGTRRVMEVTLPPRANRGCPIWW